MQREEQAQDCGESKTKEEEDKKNTNQWKKKQEEKKLKKINQKNQEGKISDKVQGKNSKKNNAKKQGKEQSKKKQQQLSQIIIKQTLEQNKETKKQQQIKPQKQQFKTLQHQISLNRNRKEQRDLIMKYIDNILIKSDSVLFLSQSCFAPKCQAVQIPNFTNTPNAQIICKYSDFPMLLANHISKIFVQAKAFFRNGSILVRKGVLNIIIVAYAYNIPVIACCQSWCFNGWDALSKEVLENKYQHLFNKYDWVQSKYLRSLILQTGIVDKSQITITLQEIYKKYHIGNIQW